MEHKEKEVESKKISRCTVTGGTTDGKNLYMEISVFDGEHTNKLAPVFPANTTAAAINSYMKELIEKSPKLPAEIESLMQSTLYWDAVEESWYVKTGTQPAVRQKDGDTHKK